jgi:hypothetical protein
MFGPKKTGLLACLPICLSWMLLAATPSMIVIYVSRYLGISISIAVSCQQMATKPSMHVQLCVMHVLSEKRSGQYLLGILSDMRTPQRKQDGEKTELVQNSVYMYEEYTSE